VDDAKVAEVFEKAYEEVRREYVLKGAREGVARALRIVLEKRFGPLQAHVHEQILEAETPTLEKWLLEVVDGATLVDVFGPEPELARGEESLSPHLREFLERGARLGVADTLVLLLQKRFGLLPRDLRRRVGEAKRATIEAWLVRAADGADLAELFDLPPES
jgi:hypothetical protein